MLKHKSEKVRVQKTLVIEYRKAAQIENYCESKFALNGDKHPPAQFHETISIQ